MFKTLLIAILLVALPAHSFVAGTDTVLVSSGVGSSVREANIDAVRNSVKSGVGIYLESQTLVKNLMLVEDKILNYSNGFVEEYEVLSIKSRHDGLYESKIRARIRRGKIHKALASLNLVKKEVRGKSLFANALTQLDRQEAVGGMVRNALDGFPTRALKVFVGNPSVISVDGSSKIATVSFPVNVKWDYKWLDQLTRRLDKATESKEHNLWYIDMGEKTGKLYAKHCTNSSTCGVIGLQELSVRKYLKNGDVQWKGNGYDAWFFDEKEAQEVIRAFGKLKHSSLGSFQSANDFAITIKLLENGEVIKKIPGSLRGSSVQLWKLRGSKLSLSQPRIPAGSTLNRVLVNVPMELLERVTSIEAVPGLDI